MVDSIRGQRHGRVHTWQNLPPQIGNVYVLRYSVDDQTKGEGRNTYIYIYHTHLNVHQMLKHIVFSQKNAARKKK